MLNTTTTNNDTNCKTENETIQHLSQSLAASVEHLQVLNDSLLVCHKMLQNTTNNFVTLCNVTENTMLKYKNQEYTSTISEYETKLNHCLQNEQHSQKPVCNDTEFLKLKSDNSSCYTNLNSESQTVVQLTRMLLNSHELLKVMNASQMLCNSRLETTSNRIENLQTEQTELRQNNSQLQSHNKSCYTNLKSESQTVVQLTRMLSNSHELLKVMNASQMLCNSRLETQSELIKILQTEQTVLQQNNSQLQTQLYKQDASVLTMNQTCAKQKNMILLCEEKVKNSQNAMKRLKKNCQNENEASYATLLEMTQNVNSCYSNLTLCFDQTQTCMHNFNQTKMLHQTLQLNQQTLIEAKNIEFSQLKAELNVCSNKINAQLATQENIENSLKMSQSLSKNYTLLETLYERLFNTNYECQTNFSNCEIQNNHLTYRFQIETQDALSTKQTNIICQQSISILKNTYQEYLQQCNNQLELFKVQIDYLQSNISQNTSTINNQTNEAEKDDREPLDYNPRYKQKYFLIFLKR